MPAPSLEASLPADPPAVSVVVPAYNQARWLRDTLQSVASQTCNDWECIVVNDGSTDDTPAIARAFVERDPRFRLVNQPNGGVSAARNRGLEEARGEFVMFLDGDDLLLPLRLEHDMARMRSGDHDLGISAIRVAWLRDENHPLNGRIWSAPGGMTDAFETFLRRWEVEFVLPPLAFTVRRSFLMKTGVRWDTSLYSHEDWDFWLQVLHHRPRLAVDQEVLAIYRVHGEGVTSQRYRCWLGYLMSWRIQRTRYANERYVAALGEHRSRMHRSYRRSFPFRNWLSRRLVDQPWFRRACPWPLQAPLRRFCGL